MPRGQLRGTVADGRIPKLNLRGQTGIDQMDKMERYRNKEQYLQRNREKVSHLTNGQ